MSSFFHGRKLSIFTFGFIAVVSLISLWILLRERPILIEKRAVTFGRFEEKIFLDGRIRSKNKITLVAFASGDIDEIKLKKGDRVQKGEKITMLHWDIHKSLISPIDGVVVAVHRASPGPINRGDHLIDIVDVQQLEIIAEPLTSEAIKIDIGDEVEIGGLSDEGLFKGEILQVSRAGFVKTSALGVEEERTEIRVGMKSVPQEMMEKLGEDFYVEIAVKVFEKDKALIVPLGSLFKLDNGWAVYKIVDGRAKTQPIEILKKNEREAIVSKGLSGGEEIIIFPSDMIKENIRVK